MAQNYRALTRTYRPQSFDDIVSQEHVSNTLKNAIRQNRISHAYMFCGPRGVGKTTMARVLARAVNEIDDTIDGESLNQTLNIVEIDAASNRKIDDIRQLKDVIRVPPQNGKYKIFIIDEVHMLTKEAFNAFLKTLEEPPAHAIFIFATTEPHKVLPTILSRVQRFDFKRIEISRIVDRLRAISEKEQITIDDESLHVIAKKADGALRDALGLMDQAIAFCGDHIEYNQLLNALNVIGKDQLFEFTDSVRDKDSTTGLTLIDSLLKEGADIQEFLVSLTEHIRNLYVSKQGDRLHMVEATEETKQRYIRESKTFSEDDLMRMLHLVSEAQLKTKDVQQPRIHFEILLLKLVHMSRTKELNSLLESLNDLKKNGLNQTSSTKSSTTSNEIKTEPKQTGRPSSNPEPAAEKSRLENNDPSVSEDPNPETSPSTPARSSHTGASEMDDEILMVKPTLGFAEGISSQSSSQKLSSELVAEPEEEEKNIKIDSVEDVEQHWKDFVNKVKDQAPQMLYFQLLRLKITGLKGNDVHVAADNEFAVNLLSENQQLLSSIFKQVTGTFLRLQCVVVRDQQKEKETISPYEQFKEIQKKDPHLKTIVELFGAELEY